MNLQNFVPLPIKKRIIQFLVSEIGSKLVPLISLAVATGVAKASSFLPQIDSIVSQGEIVTFIWVVLVAIVNFATNKWLTQDSKMIQEALVRVGADLHVDGWIGDETVEAFEKQTGIEVRRATAVDPSDENNSPATGSPST